MTTLVVPPPDARPWPTLGPQVVERIESTLVFGPGDLRGEPARVDEETRALIYRAYEVHPRGHAKAGRRRFKRVGLSMRKGTAKTEKAAWIAAVELDPEGPVRCDGWRKVGGSWQPVGAPVKDPYIPMVAYTEEQTEDLAYGALYAILNDSEIADSFDIGLERIVRSDGTGKAVALANAPDARDGARTTFQHFDETHRFTLPRLRQAHRTMLANIPKRPLADPWSLETTTMYAPGEGSIAEDTHDYARHIATGALRDSRLFYFHRQAGRHDLTTDEGLRAAVMEASGPYAAWSDIDSIVEDLRSASPHDVPYLLRIWLNIPVRDYQQAFDVEAWKRVSDPAYRVPDGAQITLGWDGSRVRDASALVGTEILTGFQWPIRIWQRPPKLTSWEVPADEVHATIDQVFRRFKVWRMYADPPYWETEVAEWIGRYGKDRVQEWHTWRKRAMAYALRGYATAIDNGQVPNNGNALMAAHLGNARRRHIDLVDDQGKRLWLIAKERDDSPHFIDASVAGCLSWEARSDALAAGLTATPTRSVYEERGVLTI